ncbi:BPI fold-containing family A member 2-like [Octodon degus]|uniref:BPI fold-containing family A member 2-like n=1 Tax=Octodon degus TaxID=10160 RepID=A0A6P6EEJ6_OCTDE|nr:BPI fold-containing family A member 2-like [Octodon degus]
MKVSGEKMFQLWKLVFLCGLLTGTSLALLSDLTGGLVNAVGQANPVLQNGLLENVENTAEGVLQKLKLDVGVLQNSSAFQQAQTKILGADHLLGNILSKLQSHDGLLGVKISRSMIVDAKLEPAANGIGATLRLPIVANVTVNLPFVGQLVNLGVSLDLLTGIDLATSAQSVLPTVAVGDCAADPASISLSLLNRNNALIQTVVDSVTKTLSNVASLLIQNQVSPLLFGPRVKLLGSWVLDSLESFSSAVSISFLMPKGHSSYSTVRRSEE